MPAYATTENSQTHNSAIVGVVKLTNESILSANVINVFRNVFPTIKNYYQEVKLNFTTSDETDFNLGKATAALGSYDRSIDEFNFVKNSTLLVQVPEGFKDRYIPYLQWLNAQGVDFIIGTKAALEAYYQSLKIFISNKDAKMDTRDNSRLYVDMEKALANAKDGLGTFFNSGSSTALAPIGAVFDRTSDIRIAVNEAKDLNRNRKSLQLDEIMKLTDSISDLLNLIIETSENEKIPEVSGQAASNMAKGALVAAHYVEFVGVLRYRIEESINALAIVLDQVKTAVKEK